MTQEFILGGRTVRIDDEDIPFFHSRDWYILFTRGKEYLASTQAVDGKRRTIYFHRCILGASPKEEVDHEDGNGLNNSRENLRLVTHQQNLANQKLSKSSTSGYKGVTLDQRKRKDGTPLSPTWMAQTKHNGRRVYLGKFPTPQEAARAYDRKMIELHGIYAKTNASLGLIPPDGGEELTRQIHKGGKKSSVGRTR